MADAGFLEEFNNRVNAFLAATPAHDVKKNVRAMCGAIFERLDLVTREEFDVQAQVLARTREKLTALEARVAALEQRVGKAP